DGTLRLDWTNGVSVLSGGVAYYEVLVTCTSGANPPAQGNCGQPINVGTVTTFNLTGLSNSKQYTVTVKAYDSSGVLLANSITVTAIPTDTPFYLYLPLILK
ncbi:MAG: fibronectin type III domain-containing protein, partial [Anaerolineae bacterium]|nr:fibronectin type III domain-containing protein [Anaerolineae bacterium]